jgi:hypothetical protein
MDLHDKLAKKGLLLVGIDPCTKTASIKAPLERIDELLEAEEKFKLLSKLHVDADRMGELLTTELRMKALLLTGVERWYGYKKAMSMLETIIDTQEDES